MKLAGRPPGGEEWTKAVRGRGYFAGDAYRAAGPGIGARLRRRLDFRSHYVLIGLRRPATSRLRSLSGAACSRLASVADAAPYELEKPAPGKPVKLELRLPGYQNKSVEISAHSSDVVLQLQRLEEQRPAPAAKPAAHAPAKRPKSDGAEKPARPGRNSAQTEVLDPWN